MFVALYRHYLVYYSCPHARLRSVRREHLQYEARYSAHGGISRGQAKWRGSHAKTVCGYTDIEYLHMDKATP